MVEKKEGREYESTAKDQIKDQILNNGSKVQNSIETRFDFSSISLEEITEDVERIKSERVAHNIITGAELLRNPKAELPMVVPGLIPKVGISFLAGMSDLGKSTFLRQGAIHLVAGEEYFCGYKLTPTHRRALIVCSEDDENAISSLLHKVCESRYKPEQLEGLQFIFDSINLEKSLRAALEENPVDLVVIDCFLDFYGNKNLNQANEVRSWLNPFKKIASDFQTQIIFLHHLGKRSDEREPNKASLLGSGAIEHAPRLVLELRAGDTPEQRYLCILKANFLPPDLKADAHELNFENLRFTSTGRRKPLPEIVKRSSERSSERREQLVEQAKELSVQGKSQRDIAKQLNIGLGTVNNYLKAEPGVHVQPNP